MALGGKRPGAGRPKGSQNKATRDLRGMAQEYTTEALSVLHEVMTTGDSAAARVAAANALLDRGYGKPVQALDVEASVSAEVKGVTWTVHDPKA